MPNGSVPVWGWWLLWVDKGVAPTPNGSVPMWRVVTSLGGLGGRTNAVEVPAVGDRGSGTVWMLALIGLIWAVAAMAMTVGGVRAARHRAYAAADLAALAAASHAADGARDACRVAGRIARGSGGRLRRCVLRGRVSEVVVVSELHDVPALGDLVATAQARAGPERVSGPCDLPIRCGVPQPSSGPSP